MEDVGHYYSIVAEKVEVVALHCMFLATNYITLLQLDFGGLFCSSWSRD